MSGSRLEDETRQVEILMMPPGVGRRCIIVATHPVGVTVGVDLTSCESTRTEIEGAAAREHQLAPSTPVQVTVGVVTIRHRIVDGGVIQVVHLTDLVKLQIDVIDIGDGRIRQRNVRRGGTGVRGSDVHRRVERRGSGHMQCVVLMPVAFRLVVVGSGGHLQGWLIKCLLKHNGSLCDLGKHHKRGDDGDKSE